MSKDIENLDIIQNSVNNNIDIFLGAMRALEIKEKSSLLGSLSGVDLTTSLRNPGFCFGLSAYLMHCSMTEYHINKGIGEPESTVAEYDKMLHNAAVISTPRTIREFYQMLDYFGKLTLPKDEQEQKQLFSKIRPFIDELVQLQVAGIRSGSVECAA